MQTPHVVATSRVPEGITVYFSDGRQAFFPNAVLYRMLQTAQVPPAQMPPGLDDLERAS